jgi:hypothetical protein
MSVLRRISESLSYIFSSPSQTNLSRSPNVQPSTSPTPAERRSRFNRFNGPNAEQGVMKLHLSYNSFSAVDDLIARSLAYELEDVDVDVSNIVQSIEIIQEDKHTTQDGANGEDEDEDVDEDKPRDRKNLLSQLDEGIDIRGKYQQQLADASRLSELGWSHDTILAFLKIARRGYEPLIPPSWKMDFPKFPPILFAKDEDDAFIKPMIKSNFFAIKAFDQLCMVGRSVRLAEFNHTGPNRSPEAMIKKHLKDYLKWAWKDAGLMEDIESGRIPCLINLANRSWRRRRQGGEITMDPFTKLEIKVKDKLETTSASLLSCLRAREAEDEYMIEPPTLFGLVIYETIVAVVAYEPLSSTGVLRQFAYYHFNKLNEEVWNSISLAILVSWARNSMLRIKEVLDQRDGVLVDVIETPSADVSQF